MNIYENLATQAITSFFYNEPLWKKKVVFDFLLAPFNLQFSEIEEVKTQDNLKETIPDFTIQTKDKNTFRYEVKINNSDLTFSEQKNDSRDAYLIRKNYYHYDRIPSKFKKGKILYWEDLFEIIDKLGATRDFSRFDLIREYMREGIHTKLLTPHEVAMFYSPETVMAVYTMSNKILELCKSFLDSHSKDYEYKECKNHDSGIGYYFQEKKGKKRDFFIGLDLTVLEKSWAIGLKVAPNEYENYVLDKEILAKSNTEEDLQEQFNRNVEEVIKNIK